VVETGSIFSAQAFNTLTTVKKARILPALETLRAIERSEKMGSCSSPTTNFEQTMDEISKAAKNNRLLTMEIEFSLRCNFSCPYCYVPQPEYFKDEMAPQEIRDTLLQARELGARKIIILGGEPTIYPKVNEMILFIRSQGMDVEMFTNGSGITLEFAQFLFDNRVRVVMKMNTFDEVLQDKLAGRKGAYEIIQSALANLKAAGYPSNDAFLAVSTVICRPNLHELPDFWRWLRDQGIEPYFEIITPQANALDNNWLFVDPHDIYNLFKALSEIDRNQYGIEWEPQPPLVGNRCLRHKFSCLVNSKGEVMPCVGLNLPIGNIRRTPLKQILSESQVLKDLKDHRNTIKGPCSTCEKADHCYGCRGAAYQMTGDYLASDPLCWCNCQCDACDPPKAAGAGL
jgi:radical SAM protein with 4Fe4S-binding SPASM domain